MRILRWRMRQQRQPGKKLHLQERQLFFQRLLLEFVLAELLLERFSSSIALQIPLVCLLELRRQLRDAPVCSWRHRTASCPLHWRIDGEGHTSRGTRRCWLFRLLWRRQLSVQIIGVITRSRR